MTHTHIEAYDMQGIDEFFELVAEWLAAKEAAAGDGPHLDRERFGSLRRRKPDAERCGVMAQ